MMTSRTHSGLSQGHTLVELLVTILVVGSCVALPMVSLVRALEEVESKTAAVVIQQGSALGQVTALYEGVPVEVTADGASVTVKPRSLPTSEAPTPGVSTSVSSNVARWRVGNSVSVRFAPGFGAPDSGGTIFLGKEARWGVVFRVETGLTRRALR